MRGGGAMQISNLRLPSGLICDAPAQITRNDLVSLRLRFCSLSETSFLSHYSSIAEVFSNCTMI
jgi:hypothetical protein